MGGAHIKLEKLTKRFGNVVAVDHLDLEVDEGRFTVLVGPSGCGKTTVLRLIAGFVEPDEGKIYLNDRLLNRVPAHKRGVAMVFQTYALFPHMNVFHNVAYGLRLRRRSREEIRRKVRQALTLLGMEGLENRWPHQLSGGQQQRVAVARALALDPAVLLMDEPLSNLDAKLRVSVRTELKDLQRRLGITTIYVTHDQEEALSISDQIAVMRDGRLLQVGSPWEVYNQPANHFVAEFMGMANLLEGIVVSSGEDNITVEILGCRIGIPNQGYTFASGENVLVGIRPESIWISKDKPEHAHYVVKGRIGRQSYLGKTLQYSVEIEEATKVFVEQYDPKSFMSGEVYLTFDPSKFRLIPRPRTANDSEHR